MALRPSSSWDVYLSGETEKGKAVQQISQFAWPSAQVDPQGRTFMVAPASVGLPEKPTPIPGPAPTALPPGVATGAGVGIIGPVAAAGAAAGLSPAAAALLGLGAYGVGTLLSDGSQAVIPGEQYGVPFGGPGLKEPGKPYLLKEWHIRMDSKEGDFDLQFYLTMNARGTKRIFMYNQRTKSWKTWPMPRLAVIGKNLPSHQMITRLRRNLKRHTADARTILKLVSPNSLRPPKRHYYSRRRGR